jgi:hypothetical protein
VASQQFVHRGRGAQRFAVTMGDGSERPDEGPEVEGWQAAQKAMQQAIMQQEARMEQEEQAKIRAGNRYEVNPWLDRTRWAQYLAEEDRGRLLPLMEKVNPSTEPILAEIGERFDRIILVAQQTILSRINVFGRFEINRKEATVDPRQPFNPRMEADTIDRYRKVWKQIIYYTVRTTMPAIRGENPPEGMVLHRYEFTYGQNMAMQHLTPNPGPWPQSRPR